MGRYGDVSQEDLRANWQRKRNPNNRNRAPNDSPENTAHTTENNTRSTRSHNVHRLFPKKSGNTKKLPLNSNGSATPDSQENELAPGTDELVDQRTTGSIPLQDGTSQSASTSSSTTQADIQSNTPNDWTEHPITKALQGFNMGLFGPNPAQIIAESLNTPFGRQGFSEPSDNKALTTPLEESTDTQEAKQPQEWTEQPFEDMPLKPIESDAPGFIEQDMETNGEGAAYEAFWNVWLGHQDYLRGQCIRMMSGNMADAEDALSNAMLRASQKFEAYSDTIVNERAWLSKLVYNVCIDHFRREQRTESRPFDQEQGMQVVDTLYTDPQQSPEEIALCQEQLDQLHNSMKQLSNNLRVPLFLRCVEGWSYPEIAERLNLRTDTVRKRIQLARDQLRRAGIR